MKKAKAKAISRVPQSREEAVTAIGRIGIIRRQIAFERGLADEAIRLAGEKFEADTADLKQELKEHELGVQAWCEANRSALTNGGKVKTHEFGTGAVKWRLRPPSVTVRGVEAVIEACKRLGFDFIRTKEEVNKEAMLAEPDKARLIPGVSISSDGEEFVIEPAELRTSSVAAG